MESPNTQSVPAALLWAAFNALPEPMAIAEPSSAIVFANAPWQRKAATGVPSVGAPPPLAADALRGYWGMPDAAGNEFSAAYSELCRGILGEWEVSWQSTQSPEHYQLTMRRLDTEQVLLVIKDVTTLAELTLSIGRLQQERDETVERLRCFATVTSETLVVSERGKILFANAGTTKMFQYSPEEVIGKSVLEFSAPEYRDEIIRHLTKDNSDKPYETVCIRADGTRFTAEVRGQVISYHGRQLRGAALLDITARKRAEKALSEKLREEERLRTQSEILAALSTPLIPISDEVLVMPLIGQLDSNRMARATEALLSGLAERRARFTIIDITGLPAVDSTTAMGLLRAAQGVRLLGAQAILSGIRVEVAKELVRLVPDFSGLITRSTLQSAVTYALNQAGRHARVRAAR